MRRGRIPGSVRSEVDVAGLARERSRSNLINRIRVGDWIFTALVSAALEKSLDASR